MFLEQGMNVINQKLTKEVKDVHVPVKIIFPFLNERDALLKFDTHEEMNEFRKCFLNDHFQLNDLPAQAVTCLNATVSQTAKMRFIEHGWNPDDIVENSGVAIKIQNECLVLEGSLLELQAARKFIQSACNQRKASVGEIQNSTDVENESLEFNNSLDIQTSKRTSQKEVSKTGEDIFDARKKVQIEETSNTNKSENDLRKLDKNVNTDISNTSISSSTPIAGEMEHQEPVEQSIREKVNMSHLDYDILENLFHPSSEITRKVHINKKKNVVEVVGSRDSVQPFRKAMRDINGYKKIPIDLNSTDLKKFWIHKKYIQDLFPKVLVLLDEDKMYLIVQEEDPELKSIVLSILSPQYKKESRDDNKGPRMSDLGSDSDFPKMQQPSQKHSPVQKTTFGKIVFQKKDISVSVMHGDILSFDIFDCLVSPTNEHLDLKKGGFSAAMLARAGEEVQKECSSKFTSYKRKIEVGNCVSTRAGNLKYSLIIHTVLCPWKSFGVSTHRDQDTLNHIKEVISRCLSEASKMKKKSIVFPAIGSGQSAIPHILLANGYRLGCESLQARTSLKEIYFVAKDSNFLSLVEKIFQTPLPWCSFWSTDDEYTFHVSNMCKVLVAKRDMQPESFVDALVVVEDPFMSGKGYLASAILKSGDRLYKNNREKLMKKNRPNGSAVICKYTGQLKFKAVVHIIMPDSKIKIWTENDVEVYKKCISNALKSLKPADRSIAMKLFVGGNKKRDVMMYFAKALTEAITEHITSEESTLQEILILNTDPMRHELVKEEFSRFTKNACNSNGYFESVVFVDCSSDLKTIETRL